MKRGGGDHYRRCKKKKKTEREKKKLPSRIQFKEAKRNANKSESVQIMKVGGLEKTMANEFWHVGTHLFEAVKIIPRFNGNMSINMGKNLNKIS